MTKAVNSRPTLLITVQSKEVAFLFPVRICSLRTNFPAARSLAGNWTRFQIRLLSARIVRQRIGKRRSKVNVCSVPFLSVDISVRDASGIKNGFNWLLFARLHTTVFLLFWERRKRHQAAQFSRNSTNEEKRKIIQEMQCRPAASGRWRCIWQIGTCWRSKRTFAPRPVVHSSIRMEWEHVCSERLGLCPCTWIFPRFVKINIWLLRSRSEGSKGEDSWPLLVLHQAPSCASVPLFLNWKGHKTRTASVSNMCHELVHSLTVPSTNLIAEVVPLLSTTSCFWPSMQKKKNVIRSTVLQFVLSLTVTKPMAFFLPLSRPDSHGHVTVKSVVFAPFGYQRGTIHQQLLVFTFW